MIPCCFLSPESDIGDIVHSLGAMNILWEMFNDSDYVSVAPHSAALNVFVLESRQVRLRLAGLCPKSSWWGWLVKFLPEKHLWSHGIK